MKYIYLFCIALCLSCNNRSNSSDKTVKSFPIITELTHHKISTPPVLYLVNNMIITDSLVITFDSKAEKFFQVFKLPHFKHLGGFIGKGKGSNEDLYISQYFNKISGNKFFYKSMNAIKIFEFSIAQNSFDLVKKIKIPGDLLNFMHLFKFKDYVFYGYSIDKNTNSEYISYNYETEEILEFGPTFPNINKEIPKSTRKNLLFNRIITVNPDQDKFAAAYVNFPFLRIYNKNGGLLSELRYENNQELPKTFFMNHDPNNPDLINMKKNSKQKTRNYLRIRSSKNYIYALYIGKTRKQLEQEENHVNTQSNEIHVWDWNGKPIKKIILDKLIRCFDVDKNDKYIISSSTDNIDLFYKYELNE